MKRFYILLLVLLSSCNALLGEKPVSILQASACRLPCWNNIRPGETTEKDVLNFLESSEVIDQDSIQIDDQPRNIFDNHIFFSLRQQWSLDPHPKVRADLYIIDNIVSDLIVCGDLGIAINDIVDAIGEPEYILSGDNLTGSRTVILLNPQDGVSYSYDTANLPESRMYELASDIKVICLNLFDLAIYINLMEIGFFSSGHYNVEETLRVMYPWDGYGNLDEKYPPRQP